MKKITLTSKQQETLEYIKTYIARNSESPTITEMQKDLGLDSLRSVTQRIEALESKGLIKRDRFQHRSIRILDTNPHEPKGTIQVPVIATAGCDAAEVYAQEQYDEFLQIDPTLTKGVRDIVALKASGNSMIDAGIHNGDYVLVEVTENVANGDRVVAILEDMAVIKTLRRTADTTVLIPESKGNGYSPIVMSNENSKIFGKVLSVIPMNFNDDYEIIYDKDIKH
ncbi:MAG: transcriptional repressor LexA [Candidatus Paceibacterota bacterium]